MSSSITGHARRLRGQLAAFWPHWPLAIVVIFVGALNCLEHFAGLRVPFETIERVRAFNSLAKSFSAVQGPARVILGLLLMLTGIGLLRRLSSAWTFSVFLLVIAVGVNVARKQWTLSLGLDAAILGSLLLAKRSFTRRTILASFLFSMTNILAVLTYGVVGSYVLGEGFHPHIKDWSAAFYFTIVSLSTVGYGDIAPATPEARWFVISLLVVGLGVFASAIASALGPKISGELSRIFNPKERKMEPKDHVILIGEGSIARNTAKELKRRKVPFVQIVSAQTDSEEVEHQIVEGDATDDVVLREAGIEHARMVIAAREDDGDNAFIALVAKDLNPNVRLLAVASSALSIRRLKLARADLVFSPAAVGSRLLADLVEGGQIASEFRDLLEGELEKDN